MIAIFLADGFEEIEAIATIDFLRRCDLDVQIIGIEVKDKRKAENLLKAIDRTVAQKFGVVYGAHDIGVICDFWAPKLLNELPWEKYDCVILPGGMPGTKNLEDSGLVQNAIEYAYQNHRLIAAICAAPSILAHFRLLEGKKATCFPGFNDDLRDGGAVYTGDYVTEDGNIITGKGAGCTIDFAEAIAARFVGKDKAREVREAMQTPY